MALRSSRQGGGSAVAAAAVGDDRCAWLGVRSGEAAGLLRVMASDRWRRRAVRLKR